MQIVIDIPEEIYKYVRGELAESECHYDYNFTVTSWNAIHNGTPLPKGHGRLIDANRLEQSMYQEAFETDSDMQKWESGCWIRYKMFENNIESAETIIEADRQ